MKQTVRQDLLYESENEWLLISQHTPIWNDSWNSRWIHRSCTLYFLSQITGISNTYILCFIKLISWKRFTNCFDLDIWYFFKQLWFQKTHTHTCICFSHSGTNCHPYSMCIYMNYHGSIMRVSSRSWCHNKLILSLATVYDNQNPVTLATTWYDSIWNLFYIKDAGSHSFLQLLFSWKIYTS